MYVLHRGVSLKIRNWIELFQLLCHWAVLSLLPTIIVEPLNRVSVVGDYSCTLSNGVRVVGLVEILVYFCFVSLNGVASTCVVVP